jgi:hypothetical protein
MNLLDRQYTLVCILCLFFLYFNYFFLALIIWAVTLNIYEDPEDTVEDEDIDCPPCEEPEKVYNLFILEESIIDAFYQKEYNL